MIQWKPGDDMTKRIIGRIYEHDETNRLIRIRHQTVIHAYYFPRGLYQTYESYLNIGAYLFLLVSPKPRVVKKMRVFTVEKVEKILFPRKQNPIVYYDIANIKSQIKLLLNQSRPKLFLDLEMSMPPYQLYQGFESEIIQYGVVSLDEFDQTTTKEDSFVKPLVRKEISDRTKRFLHIDQAVIDAGMDPKDFLERLRTLFRKNRPMVFVWGQNDVLELKKAAILHRIPDITNGVQIIDLLRLLKIFYGLKNDLGLLNAYRIHVQKETDEHQAHHALEDAIMTKEVFLSFKQVTNGLKTIDLEEYK